VARVWARALILPSVIPSSVQPAAAGIESAF
jgi:hypothetical protein